MQREFTHRKLRQLLERWEPGAARIRRQLGSAESRTLAYLASHQQKARVSAFRKGPKRERKGKGPNMCLSKGGYTYKPPPIPEIEAAFVHRESSCFLSKTPRGPCAFTPFVWSHIFVREAE